MTREPTMRATVRLFLARPLAPFAAVLALALPGCRPAGGASPQDTAQQIAELTQQANRWDEAIVRKDLSAIAGNMSEDFRQIRGNGEVVDKAVFLRDITSTDLVIDPYGVEDFEVRILGDAALLCGRTRMTGRFAGQAFTSHYRYIDTYVRRQGPWQVCSVQITPLPKPPS